MDTSKEEPERHDLTEKVLGVVTFDEAYSDLTYAEAVEKTAALNKPNEATIVSKPVADKALESLIKSKAAKLSDTLDDIIQEKPNAEDKS